MTSQSSRIWRSPSATRLVTARRLRPIRRWISCVRPLCRPRAASRSVRVLVERGSMPYSAVTQPLPLLRSHGGTRSSTVAAQSTWVLPNLARQLPSAWREMPGSRMIARISSGARPEGRMGEVSVTVSGCLQQLALGGRGLGAARPAALRRGVDLAVVELQAERGAGRDVRGGDGDAAIGVDD